MNPNTTIIYLGSSSLSLSKQLYNKSIVITNYTRSIAEMLQVLQTGKPIDEQPLPAGTNSSLYVKAQRIVAFEKKMSENLPDPEVSSDIEVLLRISRRWRRLTVLVLLQTENSAWSTGFGSRNRHRKISARSCSFWVFNHCQSYRSRRRHWLVYAPLENHHPGNTTRNTARLLWMATY